jgi:hypothetical protein
MHTQSIDDLRHPHVSWRLARTQRAKNLGHLAAVISIVTHDPHSPEQYKRRLSDLAGLSHVTIEVVTCPDPHH